MGAASLMCSTVVPLMMAPSSNSNAQPSLSTLNTMASIPKLLAATCVLKRVRKLGFKNNNPIRLLAPKGLSTKGFALYAKAFATKALIASPTPPKEGVKTSFTEINCFILLFPKRELLCFVIKFMHLAVELLLDCFLLNSSFSVKLCAVLTNSVVTSIQIQKKSQMSNEWHLGFLNYSQQTIELSGQVHCSLFTNYSYFNLTRIRHLGLNFLCNFKTQFIAIAIGYFICFYNYT